MKQKFFIGSLAVLALMASCSSSNDDLNGGATQENNIPVTFSSYLGKTATSRAGAMGVQTTSTLATNGFGLFAYYTDNSSYGTSSKPNFMYNTKVTGTPTDAPTSWTYSPLRYWPNETGTDGNGATSDDRVDHLTFFAYAPYVTPSDNATGTITGATEGITALTGNATAGDPKVSYTVAADPAKSVDLLWGVSNTATWDNVTGKALTLTQGLPYLNLIKPKVGQTVNFNFKHALSRLGLTVQGAFDQVAAGGTLKDAKITVAKVEITGENFAAKGVLNLNNTEAGVPKWETVDGASTLSLTLDGDNLNDKIKDAGDGKKAAEQPDGVTATSQNLLKDNTYFMFIPGTATTDKPLKVKITYYTTTDDPNLATGYTRVENVITKSISAADPGLKFEAGKAYTLNLVLGMTSVKVTATVADWDTGSSTQVDLPINVSTTKP